MNRNVKARKVTLQNWSKLLHLEQVYNMFPCEIQLYNPYRACSKLLSPRCHTFVQKVHWIASPPSSKTCQSICALHYIPQSMNLVGHTSSQKTASGIKVNWYNESMLYRKKIQLCFTMQTCMWSQTCVYVRGSGCTRTVKCLQNWLLFRTTFFSSLSHSLN